MAEGIRRRAERIIRENFDTGNRLAVKIAIVALRDSDSEIDQLRQALEKAQSALLDHHEWHKCQTAPDPEHGYISAEEYAESGLCEKTLSVLSALRAALESK